MNSDAIGEAGGIVVVRVYLLVMVLHPTPGFARRATSVPSAIVVAVASAIFVVVATQRPAHSAAHAGVTGRLELIISCDG